MPLFLFIFHSLYHTYNHPITFIQYIRRGLSPSPHRLTAQWDRPPCGAEPRIELGPAFQQADALPTEPRRTVTEPRRTVAEPRRTVSEPRRTVAEPRRTVTEPRRTVTEPRRTVTEPRRTVSEPRRTVRAFSPKI